MSGSGNSGGGGGFGGGGPIFNCKDVSIKTSIVSPDPKVLGTLKIKQVLTISLQTAVGPLVALTDGGALVGSIFTANLTLLIKCINDGNSFKATILSISGGDCEVLITAS